MKLKEEEMLKVLDFAYDKAVNGLPTMGTAEELAKEYLAKDGTRDEQIDSFILWQAAKCGTTGFLTSLGGLITFPITISADIGSALYFQLRMIAAIAYMRGYDIHDDKVKTFIFVCLCGNGIQEILKQTGCQIGKKITKHMIEKIPGTLITKINQAVGFRLLTKFGTKGVINLWKIIPIVPGIINGALDFRYTTMIGNKAKDLFTDVNLEESRDNHIDIESEPIA